MNNVKAGGCRTNYLVRQPPFWGGDYLFCFDELSVLETFWKIVSEERKNSSYRVF